MSYFTPVQLSQHVGKDLSQLLEAMMGNNQCTTTSAPAVNLWENSEGAYLQALLPGVEEDSLDVSILGELIRLKGRYSNPTEPEDCRWHRDDRPKGIPFVRTVRLPFQIDAEHVKAELKNGILEVQLPRAASDKPTKITIQGA